MSKFFQRFAKDESGATAIEYGLIAALIAVLIATTLTLLGPTLQQTFTNANTRLTAANAAAAAQ